MSLSQFQSGLMANYGMTLQDLNSWSYCGGDRGAHLKYFMLCNTGAMLQTPPHMDSCVCGHDIVHNCFIKNEDNTRMLVLGNCCIKKFMRQSGRTCEVCGMSHRNSSVNRCNGCRLRPQCNSCGCSIARNNRRCYPCNARENN